MSASPAVLFDLDGTLTDSRPGILASTRHAFARLSEREGRLFPLPADDAALNFIIGPPLMVSFAQLAGAEYAETLLTLYRERYVEIGAFENAVYEGIPEALDALAARGARLYVATSKNRADAERILTHFGLASRFAAIHGARADGGLSDKTELIHHVLATHSLDAARSAMIGDRKYDMIGALNNKLTAIGALWGYGGEAELSEAGATALVARPNGLVDALLPALR